MYGQNRCKMEPKGRLTIAFGYHLSDRLLPTTDFIPDFYGKNPSGTKRLDATIDGKFLRNRKINGTFSPGRGTGMSCHALRTAAEEGPCPVQ